VLRLGRRSRSRRLFLGRNLSATLKLGNFFLQLLSLTYALVAGFVERKGARIFGSLGGSAGELDHFTALCILLIGFFRVRQKILGVHQRLAGVYLFQLCAAVP